METIATLVFANRHYLVLLTLPCLSYMLYDFFQTGMIFSRYGDWLFKEHRLGQDIKWYKKPMGACLKCFHVWVIIAFYVLILLQFHGQNHWHLFGFLWYVKSIIKFIITLSISYHILFKKYF